MSMRTTTHGRVALTVVTSACLLTGCTAEQPAGSPVTVPAASTSAAAPPTPGDETTASVFAVEGVVREVEYYGLPLEVTVGPVESSGEVAVVSVEVAVDPAADPERVAEAPPLGLTTAGADIRADMSAAGASGVRLVDEASVRPVGVTSDSSFAATSGPLLLDPTTPVSMVSVHAAPDSSAVDVLVPRLGMFLDVPVVDAGPDVAAVLAEVGEPVDPPVYELRSFSATVDDVTTTTQEGELVTVTLTSDVLFDSSDHRLDAAAEAAVADAVAKVQDAAGSGEVSVVGHTDDVGDDASNQKLSEQRATAVSDELRAGLGDGYAVSDEGRGETEPVVIGTSDEAREVNRRVEIVFTAGQRAPATQDGDVLPAADVPESTGGEPVVFGTSTPGQEFRLEVDEVVRTDGGIVGAFRLTRLAGPELATAVFGGDIYSGFAARRGFAHSNQLAGIHEMALLAGGERFFPLDYEVPEDAPLSISPRRLLGEELLDFPLPEGGGIIVTGVWPDTGQDTITIEAARRFRMTDVPVRGDGAG